MFIDTFVSLVFLCFMLSARAQVNARTMISIPYKLVVGGRGSIWFCVDILVYHLTHITSQSSIMRRPLDLFSSKTRDRMWEWDGEKKRIVNEWKTLKIILCISPSTLPVFVIKLMIIYIVVLHIVCDGGVNKSVFSCFSVRAHTFCLVTWTCKWAYGIIFRINIQILYSLLIFFFSFLDIEFRVFHDNNNNNKYMSRMGSMYWFKDSTV